MSAVYEVSATGYGHRDRMTPAENRARGFRKSRFEFPDDDARHGTYYGYKMLWCRCDRCSAANSAYVADRRRRYGRASRAA